MLSRCYRESCPRPCHRCGVIFEGAGCMCPRCFKAWQARMQAPPQSPPEDVEDDPWPIKKLTPKIKLSDVDSRQLRYLADQLARYGRRFKDVWWRSPRRRVAHENDIIVRCVLERAWKEHEPGEEEAAHALGLPVAKVATRLIALREAYPWLDYAYTQVLSFERCGDENRGSSSWFTLATGKNTTFARATAAYVAALFRNYQAAAEALGVRRQNVSQLVQAFYRDINGRRPPRTRGDNRDNPSERTSSWNQYDEDEPNPDRNRALAGPGYVPTTRRAKTSWPLQAGKVFAR